MALSFASSALAEEGFDLIRTVEEARWNNFPWVQLFVNSTLQETDYLSSLAYEIAENEVNLVIHLPNIDKLNKEDLVAAERLESLFPGRDVRTLIHYDASLTPDNVPTVNGRKVAIENAKTGIFDRIHVAEAYTLAREVGSGFVFDIGRIMYADDDHSPEEILAFVFEMMDKLDPEMDIIHVAGKSDWRKRFRDSHCALGSDGDIHLPLIPQLKDFSERGGVIVFENEDLYEALDSVEAFIPLSD